MIALAVAAFLALTMFCGYHIGAQWPHDLRDRYLRMVAALAAALTIWLEPGLGLLFALAVYRWRDHYTLPPVLIFGTAAGLYALIRHGGPDTHAAAQAMLVATAMMQAIWAGYELLWVGMKRNRLTLHRARDFGRASMGNRIFVGALCAMAAPLAPLWALPVLLAGLVLTNTYTCAAAALIGLAIAHPGWWPWLLAGSATAAPFILWWRGHPRDSFAGRAHVWRLSFVTWARAPWREFWLGYGHGSFLTLGCWWSARQWTGQHYRQAHNDLVQVTVEWGALGLLGVGLWLTNVARHLEMGDPLSGAFVAMLVATLWVFPSYLPHTAVPMLAIAAMVGAK